MPLQLKHTMNTKPLPGAEEHEPDWPLAPNPTEPPAGKYIVAYQHYRWAKRYADRNTLELHFVVVEPSAWKGTPLTLYCPIPLNGLPGKRSKYVTLWTLANEGKPAPRRSRMAASIFKGYWVAEVTHTQQRMVTDGGKLKGGVQKLGPEETGIAVINRLIERAAGGIQP